jgi:dihydropyrimidine dehydrogenase (NAD+) subunit PreA
MGSAVGQVPEYCEQITRWVTEICRIPVIVKLTPNITNIIYPARAAVAAKANAISLINTLNSIVGVDLDTLAITPSIGGKSGHGGFAGPAVKPIALHLLSAVGTDEVVARSAIPISGMGGISTWQDAAEFLLLGASSLQVCTAVMHYGYRVIEDLCDGLSNWMDAKGFKTVGEVVGKSLPQISDFANFNLSFSAVARIDEHKCIKCNLCYVACNDAAHQCIDLIAGANGERPQPKVREHDCVGCRLCYNVCPVEQCIEMVELRRDRASVSWNELCQSQREISEDWEAMERYRHENAINVH